MKAQSPKMLGIPKFLIIRPINNSENFLLKTRIRMILHLLKNSRPNNASATCEKSKVMDCVNQASFLEMHQVIMYLIPE